MAGWIWAAASRAGTAHLDAGVRRQDALRVVLPGCGRHIVAVVCDGAGSASHGGEGASITARTLSECARAWLQECMGLPEHDRIDMWIALIRFRIAAAAYARGLSMRDFATTLVMALSDGGCTLTVHVGDGGIVARTHAGQWIALSWPEHGEYAATTFFVTDDDPHVRVAMHPGPIDRLVLMSDGLERLALDFGSERPHAPFFDGVCAPIDVVGRAGPDRDLSIRMSRYLESDAINSRTDDDKTLVVAASV